MLQAVAAAALSKTLPNELLTAHFAHMLPAPGNVKDARIEYVVFNTPYGTGVPGMVVPSSQCLSSYTSCHSTVVLE